MERGNASLICGAIRGMAFYNEARLFGRVCKAATIRYGEDKTPLRGEAYLHVIKGDRDYGQHIDKIEYDTPLIMTTDPEKIEEMSQWKVNDIVDIAAYLSTVDMTKRTFCKSCGEVNEKQGTISYLNPLFMCRRETGLTKEESLDILRENVEISNRVKLIGRLCEDPRQVEFKPGQFLTEYNLAVKRKKFFVNEPPDWKTDFPWVKTYGDVGVDNAEALVKGSLVMVDGFIQARIIQQKTTCSKCGEVYEWPDMAMEVVAYSVEYLQDYVKRERKDSGDGKGLSDMISDTE